MKKPLVGISTNEIVNFNGRQISHSTGQRYVNAVMRFSNVIPILIPSFLSKYDIETLINKLDGVVLTGGRANIEPKHYDGKKFPPDEPIDASSVKPVLNTNSVGLFVASKVPSERAAMAAPAAIASVPVSLGA